MEADQTTPPPYMNQPDPPKPEGGKAVKKAAGPLAVLGALLLKFKLAIFGALKLFPFLAKFGWTAGTMFVSIWAYAMLWGWWFAFGFVLLIFVHECGHLLAARRVGLKVGAPVFIPFMGAFIALKEAPRNAWIEAQVGIGGPLLGALGSLACYGIYFATGNQIYAALAYTGFFLNLFNLAPFGFLDGGRVVTALSPWLWLVGLVIVGFMMVLHFNAILLLIVIFSLPRLFSLFRKKSDVERRYYEVTTEQRWIIGILYFGLIAFLVMGMMFAQVQPQSPSVE